MEPAGQDLWAPLCPSERQYRSNRGQMPVPIWIMLLFSSEVLERCRQALPKAVSPTRLGGSVAGAALDNRCEYRGQRRPEKLLYRVPAPSAPVT